VRNAVVWCGLPDPAETREELRSQSDTESTALRSLIGAFEKIDTKGKGMTTAQIKRLLEKNQKDRRLHRRYDRAAIQQLSEAVGELCSSSSAIPSTQQIGHAFRRIRRRVVGGKALDYREEGSRTRRWLIRQV
jgi:hypothetical protein